MQEAKGEYNWCDIKFYLMGVSMENGEGRVKFPCEILPTAPSPLLCFTLHNLDKLGRSEILSCSAF